jgi:hypothetical protein
MSDKAYIFCALKKIPKNENCATIADNKPRDILSAAEGILPLIFIEYY